MSVDPLDCFWRGYAQRERLPHRSDRSERGVLPEVTDLQVALLVEGSSGRKNVELVSLFILRYPEAARVNVWTENAKPLLKNHLSTTFLGEKGTLWLLYILYHPFSLLVNNKMIDKGCVLWFPLGARREMRYVL